MKKVFSGVVNHRVRKRALSWTWRQKREGRGRFSNLGGVVSGGGHGGVQVWGAGYG